MPYLSILGMLVALGVVDDTGLEVGAEFCTSDKTITVRISFSVKAGNELLAENGLVRHLFVFPAGGNELADRLGRLVADILRYGTAEGKKGAGKAGVKEKDGMLGIDDAGEFLDPLHGHGFSFELVTIDFRVGSILGDNIADRVTAVGRLKGMAMAGKIKEEPVVRIIAVFGNKILKRQEIPERISGIFDSAH